MLWEVDVSVADAAADHAARDLVAAATALGITGCSAARTAAGWLIEADVDRGTVERLAAVLLADPVSERFVVDVVAAPRLTDSFDGLPTVVHVLPRAGVTDPAGLSATGALALIGHGGVTVRSLTKYWLPPLPPATAAELVRRLVANDAIHDVVVGPLQLDSLAGGGTWAFVRQTVPLADLDDPALERLSRDRCLALAVAELHAIRDHFHTPGRDPFEIELETLAQTWSEHCCHKTLTSPVEHTGPGGTIRYANLLKDTVFAATQKVRAALGAGDWCVSVFRDNSAWSASTVTTTCA